MPSASLIEALKRRILLCDGAMGTQLQLAGLRPGQCGEAWNLEKPSEILQIQQRYAQAGADCLITNTFGANARVLKKHGLDGRVAEINQAAVRIARQAAGAEAYVLGDIGPLGEMLEPLGDITEEQAAALFDEQAAALIEAGADAIIIETMMALDELLCAVGAVRARSASIPVIASMAYDRLPAGGYATLMGISPEQQAQQCAAAGADIIACNCGTSLAVADHAALITAFGRACDRPLMTQPNAGKPEVQGERVIYRETPEKMAEDIPALIAAGARIIGGCCGTTPAHIAAFRERLRAA